MLEKESVLHRLYGLCFGLRYSVEVTIGGDTVVIEVMVLVTVLVLVVLTFWRS